MAGYTLGEMFRFTPSNRNSTKTVRDRLERKGYKITYNVWGNPIAILNTKHKTLTTSSAGWETNLTKNRLNKIIPFGTIRQRKGKWNLSYMKNNQVTSIPFKTGLKFNLRKLGY